MNEVYIDEINFVKSLQGLIFIKDNKFLLDIWGLRVIPRYTFATPLTESQNILSVKTNFKNFLSIFLAFSTAFKRAQA